MALAVGKASVTAMTVTAYSLHGYALLFHGSDLCLTIEFPEQKVSWNALKALPFCSVCNFYAANLQK